MQLAARDGDCAPRDADLSLEPSRGPVLCLKDEGRSAIGRPAPLAPSKYSPCSHHTNRESRYIGIEGE